MPGQILWAAEQRDGKLNRASLETLACAQAIGKQMSTPVEVVVPGGHAEELATYQAQKVYALTGPSLETYTSDAYVHALKELITRLEPKLVLFPHTYQVR